MIYVAIIFIVLGILIKYGRLYFLIAGYNTMSDEEKAKYNIAGIANLFFRVMLAMGLVIILGSVIASLLDYQTLETIIFFATLAFGIPYLLIRSNSDRYKIDLD